MSAKKRTNTFNPIRKNVDPRTERGEGTNFVQLKTGDTLDVICLWELEEILVTDQCAIWLEEGNSPVWVYTGPNDPSHELGIDRRYRAYLPVVLNGEVMVLPFGKSIHKQLAEISEAMGGELKGLEVRVKRTGSGLNTRYSVINRGKRHNVDGYEEVDVIAMLGPLDSDEIREMIAKKLMKDDYDDVLAAYNGKTVTSSGQPKASSGKKKGRPKAKPVVVEEEEDDDEDELLIGVDDEDDDELLLDDEDEEDDE